ncbi:MAG TPA: glycosyltransferase family 4 protein [Lysobacter sp.]|nr:glycosyltransferase family 4 protein [Lysobacter sp.]
MQSNIDVHAGRVSLSLLAWIRRQSWLRAVYQRFPQAWRDGLSSVVVARALRKARFPDLPAPAPDAAPVPVAAETENRKSTTYPASAGINIFAYLRGQFGLGESARMYTHALLSLGYPVALHDIDIGVPHGFEDRSLDQHIGDTAPHRINLIFVNPDYLAEALASIDRAKIEGGYNIACWFWELERIPDEWRWALDEVDEIMVATAFVEQAFRRATDKPILRVPMPISDVADSGLTREQFGLAPDKFIFLNTFDFNSWWCRKNPIAVIDAFRLAFPQSRDDVQLLIKSSNGHRHPEKLHQLLTAASGDPRIFVRDEVIDRRHVRALQRCVDAYVSLHRAEGFGLGLAEAMSLGKPVIGTGWSGNLEFMTQENSCLANYRLVPVGDDEYPHAKGAQWAQVDIEHAAILMRKIVDDPGFARKIGAQAAVDIRDKLSPVTMGRKIIERLNRLAIAFET